MDKEALEELKSLIIKAAKNRKISSDSFFDIVNNVSEKYKLGEDFLDKAIDAVSKDGLEFDSFEEEYSSYNVDEDGYSEDIVASYFKTISKIPLLTENEELDLAIKLANSDNEKEKELLTEKFIKSNLKLVVSVAKKYGHCCSASIDFVDMIQEGNLGLGKAVEKFDYRKGYKFSTYATWWIKQAITRYIADASKTIRVPVHAYEKTKKLYKVINDAFADGEKLSDSELADMLGWDIEQVRYYKNVGQDPVSLSTPVNDEEDSEIGTFIADDTVSVYEEIENRALRNSLYSVLSFLKPREQKIIEYRFGLYDGKIYTLEEISRMPEYNLTRERVRQIEEKALKKIRTNPNLLRQLKDYIDSDPSERSGYFR